MKNDKKEAARRLRLTGKSVKAIAREIGVAYSSVSTWVRDVPLTDEQKSTLWERGHRNQKVAADANKRLSRERRLRWQEEGAEMYGREGKEFAMGCALYWAEGTKNRNNLAICNTDEAMLVLFLSFLRRFFQLPDDEVRVTICCYLNNGLTVEEIQDYWLKVFGLPASAIRRATLKSKYYDGKESAKHPYGVCRLDVGRTDILQKIYGAIAKATGTSGEKWIG